jgi:mono/diheme cytochrome c family protein
MSRRRYLPLMVMLAAVGSAAHGAALPADHAEKMTRGLDIFRREVAPLLRDQCVKCHGGEKIKADFDLATREGLLQGGENGPAVEPFNAKASGLMKLIRHEAEPAMPEKKPKLSDAAIARVAEWIDLGAPYDEPLVAGKTPPRDKSVVSDTDRQWWSFQPLSGVTPPAPAPHPVDAFLAKAGEVKQLGLNPPADPRTLIRRAYLDLTGLPPAPAEVDAFAANPSPATWDAIVGRLLDSPAYGERWARHWLDVARFAESSGFEHDYDRPHAYHYRDFIIKALNRDMPFDQFARWQLAGDEFAPGDPLALMATGFLGAGVFPTQITANEVERTRYDALDDMLSTAGSAFLGLSVGCARCHDHKFDPIPTADYYRLLSTFTTTVRSNIPVAVQPEDGGAALARWQKEGETLAAEAAAAESTLRPAFEEWLAHGDPRPAASAWSLLEPAGLKSQAKATFQALGDGSYLVEGPNGKRDTYTITTPVAGKALTALRLEALAHPSMSRSGPGRAGNGNFALSKITVGMTAGKGPPVDVKIARALAGHQQNAGSLSVASSLDEDPNSGWAVDGQIGRDHAAVFVFDQPLTPPPGAVLTIKLAFSVNDRHNIGRLRLALTSAANPALEGGALSGPVATALQRARAGAPLTEAERTLLFGWWKPQQKSWQTVSAKLTAHQSRQPDHKSTVLVCAEGYPPLVMHSQGAPFFEETHLLKRGDTNQKQAVAAPGFLQVLMRGADEKRWQWTPPAGAPYSGRRHRLADWLTDVPHGAGALLARVAVNRLWQHHFGRGLVATPNDFGRTGTLPSHPELLDWLAGELIREGWRLKPIHRLLMTSAAYQQAAKSDAAKVFADPDNVLFLRRNPQRLEAEAVRDSALAVSGVLDRTQFGAGTLDENSPRRSIYFTVKRSRLVNSMVVFDAPEPLASQGSRSVTTVAPQALLLMNSPQARRWALAFAKRVQAETASASPAALVTRAYQLALGRAPRDAESASALEFLTSGAADYQGKPDAATLALADFCQAVLALNEFIYVN